MRHNTEYLLTYLSQREAVPLVYGVAVLQAAMEVVAAADPQRVAVWGM